ncbi:ATP-binding cassette domain-containing protein [Pseudemcibacter aquimaris]|uniref:ATP-binding cassette domain-containing protein n=1 Tax=Pseudemcibacter aquimaris TaxID=2857064 RepID=UPI00201294B6|nr:ATP-binding cassette domain-containing protein [Pseudemcibacter aquimaris]MCC3862132.1 ATP-binding cassette domain-containing protein [Pseudemcibacter aquimaris]WDU58885.1 ATP-binding cassette domain-containing protein [Pseudemcibacter aquimaris]
MNKSALSIKNVSISHDKGKALNNVSLEIKIGKNTVILGPNGAGKSILLKLCHGLLTPDTGTVHFENPNTRTAMVFPKPIFLRRSVLENLTFVLDHQKLQKDEKQKLALQALNQFNMTDFADYPARQLSSGEKQRLSLIRALLLKPDILFLDEPTANLDPSATASLEEMIKKSHLTTVMASHDLMQAKRIAEEIIFIENGVVIEVSAASQFFEKPQTEQAQRFIEGRL